MMQKTVLTIAGFDPSSGAGVTADLMVFAAHGLFGTSCITALTVQSTLGVMATHPVSADVVKDTLSCLDADYRTCGIKVGMLASSGNASALCSFLEEIKPPVEVLSSPHVVTVLDPVIRSTSGRELLKPAGVEILRERLLPLVDWVTPNLEELGVLVGEPVVRREDVPMACRKLQAQSGEKMRATKLGIFATGGHLEPPDDFLLTPEGDEVWLPGQRVATKSTHGTGCALSSAFLSRLVLGDKAEEAARSAKTYVTRALQTATEIGSGNGPMNHLWTRPFGSNALEHKKDGSGLGAADAGAAGADLLG